MDLAELQGLGSNPIRPDAPTGESYRDEEEFEKLQNECRKLEQAAGEQPDWAEVTRLSTKILREKSKDLLAASYLCVGLLQQDGFPGFSAGLKVLQEMMETHWDNLFPPRKRLRGRLGAIDWLVERGAAQVWSSSG